MLPHTKSMKNPPSLIYYSYPEDLPLVFSIFSVYILHIGYMQIVANYWSFFAAWDCKLGREILSWYFLAKSQQQFLVFFFFWSACNMTMNTRSSSTKRWRCNQSTHIMNMKWIVTRKQYVYIIQQINHFAFFAHFYPFYFCVFFPRKKKTKWRPKQDEITNLTFWQNRSNHLRKKILQY